MFRVRRAHERGHANHGWLDAHHTFSFSSYYDPAHEQFRTLRVMNEDRVGPGGGFGTHPHRDMEIVTYVLSGQLEHKDSLGNGAVLKAGQLQRMTAGTGIRHSEFNPSSTETVHLYQMWVFPREEGLPPSYEDRTFPVEGRQGKWQLVASADGAEDSMVLQQDASLRLARLEPGQMLAHAFEPGRHGWLQVVTGDVEAGGEALATSDGLAVSDEPLLTLVAKTPAEVMLWELT